MADGARKERGPDHMEPCRPWEVRGEPLESFAGEWHDLD